MIYILDDDTSSLFLSGTAATAGGRYLKKKKIKIIKVQKKMSEQSYNVEEAINTRL